MNKEIGSTTSNSIVATNHSRFISKRISTLLFSLICALTLAACAGGGGGGGGGTPEVKPPPSISVLNLRVIPDTNNATLIWDNPDADIANISISYKNSTADDFEDPILTLTDSPAIDRNATNVRGAIPADSLTRNEIYTFRVAFEFKGADANKSIIAEEITRLIGPNLDGDYYADADRLEIDEDGDGTNDNLDAFPRDAALFGFGVTDLTANPGNGEITLSWTNPVANISGISISYYNINMPNDLQSHPLIEDSSQTSPGTENVQETISSLINGQSYNFTVSLTLDRDDAGKRVSAVSIPATPNLFTVMGLDARPGDSSVTLSWTNPDTDNIVSINISYYNRNTPDDLEYFSLITDNTKIASGVEVQQSITTGLTNGEYYTFVVALTLGDTDAGSEGAPQSTEEVAIGPDIDGDGFPNSLDVDDDGDGLIEIATAEQLNQSRHNLSGSSFKTSPGDAGDDDGCGGQNTGITRCNGYELSANISLADYNNWEPIGSCLNFNSGDCAPTTEFFSAIFDGNGYIISNLTIADPAGDYANAIGFFGAISHDSVLHNIHIRSANLSGGGNNTGLLVGYARRAEISNSSTEGEVSASGSNVGGLVGYGFATTITSSYATGSSVSGGANDVGGLVGHGVFSRITSSYTIGSSVSGGVINVGGLVGSGGTTTITSSYVAGGSVSGGTNNVGGLVGTGFTTTITSSYTTGVNISGTREVGGLVGNGQSARITSSYASDGSVVGSADIVGGLVGFSGGSTITSSYVANISVSGTRQVGGLVGNGNNASITSSYAAGSVMGGDSVGGLVGAGPINAASSNFYWDNETSGVTVTIGDAEGADEGRSTADLQTQ